MDRPLLFAETPRAGRWNHRFLVPEDLDMSEEELAEEASYARQQSQGDNYLAVVREVHQPSSGRPADELLVLHGIQVEQMDAATRRELLKRLESRLDDLGRLVQSMDWEHEGKRLLVTRRELTTWFDNDFAEELAACRGPAPVMETTTAEAVDAELQRHSWLLPVLGVALAITGLWLWRPWAAAPGGSNAPPAETLAPNVVSSPTDPPRPHKQRSHAASINESELHNLESALRQLANHWQLPQRRDSVDTLGAAVVEKLERDLALSAVDTSLPIEQRLPDIVGSLGAQFFRRAATHTMTVVDQLQDAGFQGRLLSVYRGSRLDYAAPLRQMVASNDYDRQSQLRALAALCAASSKQEVAEFRAVVDAARRLTFTASSADSLDDTELVERLHEAARLSSTLQWPAEMVRDDAPLSLAVLDEVDAASAEVLLRWLNAGVANQSAGFTEEESVAAIRRFIDEKRDFLEVLAAQDPPGQRRHAIDAAMLLLAIDRMFD